MSQPEETDAALRAHMADVERDPDSQWNAGCSSCSEALRRGLTGTTALQEASRRLGEAVMRDPGSAGTLRAMAARAPISDEPDDLTSRGVSR